jgi:hypothetical protein
MKIKLFLLIAALVIPGGLAKIYGQGKIILLNGKEKRFKTAQLKGEFLEYQPEGTEQGKIRKLDMFDVFSLLHDSTGEELLYRPDTVAGLDPTVDEARDYIKGEKYAALVYRKPLNMISGIAVGAASGFLLDAFYGLIAPAVYPAILGQFTPKLKHAPYDRYSFDERTYTFKPLEPGTPPQNIVVSDAFHAGYGKKARNMKIKNSLIGGGIGFALGVTALLIVSND